MSRSSPKSSHFAKYEHIHTYIYTRHTYTFIYTLKPSIKPLFNNLKLYKKFLLDGGEQLLVSVKIGKNK